MKKYEIMYIVRPTLDDNERTGLIKELADIFPKFNSKIIESNELGLKELAYEIQKYTKGFYVLLNVEANTEAINEFDRIARIRENVIRYIVIKD